MASRNHPSRIERLAAITLAVRFIGFWSGVGLLASFVAGITLPTSVQWILGAFTAFTIIYSVMYSIAKSRAENPDEPAAAFYFAALFVWGFWLAVAGAIIVLGWWLLT